MWPSLYCKMQARYGDPTFSMLVFFRWVGGFGEFVRFPSTDDLSEEYRCLYLWPRCLGLGYVENVGAMAYDILRWRFRGEQLSWVKSWFEKSTSWHKSAPVATNVQTRCHTARLCSKLVQVVGFSTLSGDSKVGHPKPESL